MTGAVPDIAHRFTAAFNAGDVDGVLGCFTPDALYADLFYGRFTGRAGLQRLFERMYPEGEQHEWIMIQMAADWLQPRLHGLDDPRYPSLLGVLIVKTSRESAGPTCWWRRYAGRNSCLSMIWRARSWGPGIMEAIKSPRRATRAGTAVWAAPGPSRGFPHASPAVPRCSAPPAGPGR